MSKESAEIINLVNERFRKKNLNAITGYESIFNQIKEGKKRLPKGMLGDLLDRANFEIEVYCKQEDLDEEDYVYRQDCFGRIFQKFEINKKEEKRITIM
jgi:hypothetical protein